MKKQTISILNGDAVAMLKTLPDESVNCCVTSPPYWGLRDYGHAGQIGQEETPAHFVAAIVAVFAEVRRVLRKDGTLWLNLGDTYASTWSCGRRNAVGNEACDYGSRQNRRVGGLKEKDLIGIPWRVAFALQNDGWYLRSDIIWNKPSAMPESVTDRPTRAHEYLFLLSKSSKYHYDHDAIKEPCALGSDPVVPWSDRKEAGEPLRNGISNVVPSLNRKPDKQRGHSRKHAGFNDRWDKMEREEQCSGMRNKRDVWTVAPANYPDAHFATYPPALIQPCILAGCPSGGVVLDPFGGSGTTGQVALELGRSAILIEINPAYIPLIEKRTNITPGFAL